MTTYATHADGEVRPRRRRGRRLLVVLAVLLLVLLGITVIGDRVAAGAAQRVIAEQVAQELARQEIRSSAPEVDIGGFPFLTQVAAGKYQDINIKLRDVQRAGLTLPQLDVSAHDVAAPLETLRSRQGEIVAKTVDGTGTVAYDSVAELINRNGISGVTLVEQAGKLRVTAPVALLGQQFTVTGTATLTATNGKIAVNVENLTADGAPGVSALDAFLAGYAEQLSVTLPLPQMPFELSVQRVRVLPDGLEVSATAQDVLLNGAMG